MCENLCALQNLDDTCVLSNLKTRYANKNIYTYASDVLLAINPYENLAHLYGSGEITRYQAGNASREPPHIYAIANKALTNLRMSKKHQSIVITGISGSGKTENGKHLIDFLCQTSQSRDTNYVGPIYEAFGNASTRGNVNSSRFCNHIELMYNEDIKQSGFKIHYHLLETNRVCVADPYESNFHIFYALLHGSTFDHSSKLCIDPSISYKYLPDEDFVKKSNGNTNWYNYFKCVDDKLDKLGFTARNKDSIYKVLSSILNLGNIEFDSSKDGDVVIKTDSREFLRRAAILLDISESDLEDAMISHSIEVASQQIKIPSTETAAEKARDSLAKSLYDKIFGQIMQHINDHLSPSSYNNHSISILDIPGFEYLSEGNNTFDQLCINYCNERVQSFFVELKLSEEKEWYDDQGLDTPFVEFFDNTHIIDLFDNKMKGLFVLLNDECVFQKPSVKNFSITLKNAWQRDVAAPISWDIRGHKTKENMFLIRHFTNEVTYSMDDFVDKNRKNMPNVLRSIIRTSRGIFEKPVTLAKSERIFKTTASTLKNGIDSLLESMKKTDLYFVRCFSPNNEKEKGKFEDELILTQLVSTAIISYAKFIRFGFPNHIALQKLIDDCAPIEKKFNKAGVNQLDFCSTVLKSLGFRPKDFKMGKDTIFFRSDKFNLLQGFFSGTTHNEENTPAVAARIEGYFRRLMWRRVIIATRFLLRWNNLSSAKKKPTVAEDVVEPIHIQEETTEVKTVAQECRKRQPPTLQDDSVPKKRAKTEKRPLPSLRFDQIGHFPQIDKARLARCKNDRCDKKSYIVCSKCNIHLCLNISENRNCFTQFHTI